MLTQNAYGVQDFQIAGGPAWLQTDGSSIDAKAGTETTPAEIYRMLKTLLAERLQLQIRRETKEMAVYNLTVAKGGSELQRRREVAWHPSPVFRCRRARCRVGVYWRLRARTLWSGIHGGKVPMTELIRALSRSLGRPVNDKTGIREPFDLRLEFTPDDATAGIPSAPSGDPGRGAAIDPNAAPSIFAAVQDQLGLRLEPAKGPVEILVVYHAERPAVN